MKQQKKEKNQFIQQKQEQTNLQKFISVLYRMFVYDQKQSIQINHAVVTGTYFQIFSIGNILLLFTAFSNTNSSTYSIINACLCSALFIFDLFPKISKKHFVFNFISFASALILAGILISFKFLLDNYFIFNQHCDQFKTYHNSRAYSLGPKDGILSMCSAIKTAFVFGKLVHIVLYVRAYRFARQKHEDDQKKRRRKDRYNQMMRKRYIYNQKRKV